jgi:hypothetical protein
MAYNQITFLDYPNEISQISVNFPAWGYETEIHMPICITQAADGSYPDNGFFDPLADDGVTLGSYDYRILKSALIRMTNYQKNYYNAFMRNVVLGRAQNMVMRLTAGQGFFPFGPDLSDNGNFVVRELSRQQSGKQMRPFRWYEDTVSYVLIGLGSGTPSATPHSQGHLQIGAVTGLMYPQSGIKCDPKYEVQTQTTITGAPSSINGPLVGDSWVASFELLCNTYNAAALIYQFTHTTRTSDLTVVVPQHYDMFGVDQSYLGAGGTFITKFLGSSRTDKEIVLNIKHIGHNQFLIPITLWLKAKI